MKYFKVKKSRIAPSYEINEENFENMTLHQYPFEQGGKHISQYAICPSCLNPIQIIGLIRKTKMAPYGKHTEKDIDDLANRNQVKYVFCPYADSKHRRKMDDNELLPDITEDIVELYNLLKENFDKVVYFISKELNIKCSAAFWEKVLDDFLYNRAYCYAWLTENNLPYVLVYSGMRHKNVYNQSFKVDSEVFEELNQNPDIKFEDSSYGKEYKRLSSNGKYLALEFRLCGHYQNGIEGKELYESMHFCIDDIKDKNNVKVCLEKEIVFDQHHFMNLVRYNSYRNQQLLDIATKLMPPLKVSE